MLLKQEQAYGCCSVLQAAVELSDRKITWLHSHAKKEKKSQNATQNIVKPHLQCQAMQNTYKLRLHDNMELVR